MDIFQIYHFCTMSSLPVRRAFVHRLCSSTDKRRLADNAVEVRCSCDNDYEDVSKWGIPFFSTPSALVCFSVSCIQL